MIWARILLLQPLIADDIRFIPRALPAAGLPVQIASC
jgi:hypothetical protein